MKYIIIITIGLVLTSCGLELERDNPLDPLGNGMSAPDKVIVYELPLTSNGSVLLQWMIQYDAVGYKIYRSLSYDGNYLLIAEKETSDDGTYEDISEALVSETWYYYKISAYNSMGLEGVRSDPLFTYFIDESTR